MSRMGVPIERTDLRELAGAINKYANRKGGTSPFTTAIPGLTILRFDHAKLPTRIISKPALCVSVQGAKWTAFGEKRFYYPAGHALVVSVETPSRGAVSAASPAKPFLGIVIEFDLAIARDLISQLGRRIESRDRDPGRGAFLTPVTPPLADCALRGIRLLDTPEAIPMLYPGILREMTYWLLAGDHGARLASDLMGSTHESSVIAAIHMLRSRFAEALRIEELATVAGMSTVTFHRHFKAITSLSPLQYQKQLRLLEARRLMVMDHITAEVAAFTVGYESPSQFSREYTRMFGQSPRRDIAALSLPAA